MDFQGNIVQGGVATKHLGYVLNTDVGGSLLSH